MRMLLALGCLAFGANALAAADEPWSKIDKEVEAAIARNELPGAVIAVVHDDKVVFKKAFGQRAKLPSPEPMTIDTIFDLASLTKPIATATSIWTIIEAGKLKI